MNEHVLLLNWVLDAYITIIYYLYLATLIFTKELCHEVIAQKAIQLTLYTI